MQGLVDSPGSLLASFASVKAIGRLIILSGPSGSGKTHWCLGLADHAVGLGILASGLISPAVFEGDRKVGIDLRDLRSGARRHLAVRREAPEQGQPTAEWLFDDETLVWGNGILAELGDCHLFILDELGPLELEHGAGLTNGLSVVASRRYRLACVVIRPALLDLARSLWPWGEVLHIKASHPVEVPE